MSPGESFGKFPELLFGKKGLIPALQAVAGRFLKRNRVDVVTECVAR